METMKMTEVYRLTVRTVDGTVFISDYDDEHKARNMMDKFFVTDKNLLSYKWCEGDDKTWIKLDKICSATVKKVEICETESVNLTNPSAIEVEAKVSDYRGKIHVKEAN